MIYVIMPDSLLDHFVEESSLTSVFWQVAKNQDRFKLCMKDLIFKTVFHTIDTSII